MTATIEHGVSKNAPFLVMQLVRGQPLGQRIHREGAVAAELSIAQKRDRGADPELQRNLLREVIPNPPHDWRRDSAKVAHRRQLVAAGIAERRRGVIRQPQWAHTPKLR